MTAVAEIEGVGEAYAAKLSAAGVQTTEALLGEGDARQAAGDRGEDGDQREADLEVGQQRGPVSDQGRCRTVSGAARGCLR
jgi:hypothetical protein